MHLTKISCFQNINNNIVFFGLQLCVSKIYLQNIGGFGCSLEGLMLKPKLQYFGHLMQRADLIGKDPDAGRDWWQEEKGTTEDEMIGWHH